MQQSLLTILILLPVLGAIALVGYNALTRGGSEKQLRIITLAFTIMTFALSLFLLQGSERGTAAGASAFSFEQNVS